MKTSIFQILRNRSASDLRAAWIWDVTCKFFSIRSLLQCVASSATLPTHLAPRRTSPTSFGEVWVEIVFGPLGGISFLPCWRSRANLVGVIYQTLAWLLRSGLQCAQAPLLMRACVSQCCGPRWPGLCNYLFHDWASKRFFFFKKKKWPISDLQWPNSSRHSRRKFSCVAS